MFGLSHRLWRVQKRAAFSNDLEFSENVFLHFAARRCLSFLLSLSQHIFSSFLSVSSKESRRSPKRRFYAKLLLLFCFCLSSKNTRIYENCSPVDFVTCRDYISKHKKRSWPIRIMSTTAADVTKTSLTEREMTTKRLRVTIGLIGKRFPFPSFLSFVRDSRRFSETRGFVRVWFVYPGQVSRLAELRFYKSHNSHQCVILRRCGVLLLAASKRGCLLQELLFE